MKKTLILVITSLMAIIAFSGCMQRTIVHIDWVDFVKWDGISYERDFNVIVPSEIVGESVGLVAKNAPSEVRSPNYEPEDGMAAFLPVGTEFFEIDGYDRSKYIAVYTDGYYILYRSHDSESISFSVPEND